ncbi:unnamed protein product [Meganyctiphanes norvegica]|uniref:Uncharacterized protein n=1 Tax=Meganyctiphanes norvegica TaxID=48144 RepID=A0AAV2R409_MEGNR
MNKKQILNFRIQTKIGRKAHSIFISKKRLYCEKGLFKPFYSLDDMPNINFDAYLNGSSYCIFCMWVGARPLAIYKNWTDILSDLELERLNNDYISKTHPELSENSRMNQKRIHEDSYDTNEMPLYNDYPKYLLNWDGTLSAKCDNKDKNSINHFLITTKIAEKDYVIFVPKENFTWKMKC